MALRWIAWNESADGANLLEHLASLMRPGRMRVVYEMGHRTVYRAESETLGPVAIKEVRHLRLAQRFKLRYFRQPKAVTEFLNSLEFARRKGDTPAPYAAAVQQNLIGMSKVFQFYQWIENAMTLTDKVREFGGRPPAVFWTSVARSLVDGARKGLVHNGHSSENLLVTPDGDGWRFHTIDLSEARLGGGFDADGFARDVARISRKLLMLKACGRETVDEFVAAVAATAWPDAPGRWRDHILQQADAGGGSQ